MRKMILGAALAALSFIPASFCGAQTTVTFQQGVDGYNGTFDLIIGRNNLEEDIDLEFGDSNVLGSSVEGYFLDGSGGDFFEALDEKQGLIRFGGIIEALPEGARVLSATLEISTPDIDFADTNGPYSVARLLVGFDGTTTYNSVTDGLRFDDNNETDRPLVNGIGTVAKGETASIDVTRIVQQWNSGETNHGFVITAGTTNGWAIHTTGALDTSKRPKLSITYTMDAAAETETTTITQDTEDENTANFRLSKTNDTWTNGDEANALGEFLDGNSGAEEGMLRFDSIFQADGGSIPNGAKIAKATLIINTGGYSRSQHVGTGGEYGVRQITSAWDGTQLYADLTFGDFVDGQSDMICDSQTRFDVTSIVKAWQNGEANNGFNIASTGTTDGWAILLSSAGTAAAPKLEIQWSNFVQGDANGDGEFDTADISAFVMALVDSEGYAAAFPGIDPVAVLDFNDDGEFDTGDIAGFVDALIN